MYVEVARMDFPPVGFYRLPKGEYDRIRPVLCKLASELADDDGWATVRFALEHIDYRLTVIAVRTGGTESAVIERALLDALEAELGCGLVVQEYEPIKAEQEYRGGILATALG
jgi:hypothetical protein